MRFSTIFTILVLLVSAPHRTLANGEITSPNMSMPVPQAGITTGPQWAADLVTSLGLIDSHDHSAGKGVQITPAGMDITSDLEFNINNIINPRSVRFSPLGSTLTASADVGAIYESGVDLYYRDGNGNNIRLTQSGSIVGTAGSISGLTAPASASYVPSGSTFVWQSAVNTAANLDAGCLLQRDLTASSNAITICPPGALAANYSLTWPAALPASQKFATIDSSGNIAAPWSVDNSTIAIVSGSVQVKTAGITQGLLAARATGTSVGAGGVASSASSGGYTDNSGFLNDVTNLSITITTTGRPVDVRVIPDGTSNTSSIGISVPGDQIIASGNFYIYRDGASVSQNFLQNNNGVAGSAFLFVSTYVPPASLNFIDFPSAGSHTYLVKAQCGSFATISVLYSKLVAFEL